MTQSKSVSIGGQNVLLCFRHGWSFFYQQEMTRINVGLALSYVKLKFYFPHGKYMCNIYVPSGCRAPSALGPGVSYSLGGAQSYLADVTRSFCILFVLPWMLVYWFLWPLCFGWLLILDFYKEDYLQVLKYVSFWLHGCCRDLEVWPVNLLTTPVGWWSLLKLTILSGFTIAV